uniref:3-hydroxyanthranilate 3,4-dioxygenase n=1 Tax=Chromera velia CCMP2878 TaxID=1169474 RepID=A0A0G4IAE7_9ALVE|mmetsp:Transcript_34591/g.68367  ORF Transcript_34591/g.68367 Transcript_34591/m.68367 type:complete len:176 (-) Transcript_34591:40-567(-)|eukprot:Cvel_2104.t1-p1 / transcript=Cvel_2104.t1 / gene=Cvel_2104 / organism=Chromera_velia_CCMP2878 / gene_product=3-hydroxyanthranilate 3,4-dioxygenase, putative / transcript_product=3-hydroxyanthranilate 3,4-dioxygenase, putative / location=Cvel_scaffold81:53408-56521(+) / protein_length=175 / sequence_SO=supercontig / SO=protein_coding / is_pseudo=false
MEGFQPFNFFKLVEELKEKGELQPPVGNKLLFSKGEFKVMVVGGPNTRTDFHWECGEEWFFQIQGKLRLRTKKKEDAPIEDIILTDGDMYLLPPRVYHSPQREEGSVGIVIERERGAQEDHDKLCWFCQDCGQKLYEETFHCTDLGSQLAPVIKKYYSDEKLRTCKACGWVEPAP